MAPPTEISIPIADGSTIAGLQYTSSPATTTTSPHHVILLHGWLDNCASMHPLASHLSSLSSSSSTPLTITAIDFVGHGLSSHKSKDSPMILSDYVYYVKEIADSLLPADANFTLVGHSMGSGVGCMFAGAFPDRVNKLVMIEGAGPMYRDATNAPTHLKDHVIKRSLSNKKTERVPRVYPSVDAATSVRLKTVSNSPGDQYMSEGTARRLVLRATEEVEGGGVKFRHDTRLHHPSIMYNTKEATQAYLDAITCPVLFVLGNDGWPLGRELTPDKIESLVSTGKAIKLPGSHHLHSDEDTSTAVGVAIAEFLNAD